MILAMPAGQSQEKGTLYDTGTYRDRGRESGGAMPGSGGTATFGDNSYVASLEERVKEILKNVEGVGQVDVMIALKSTEEKVLQTDQSTSSLPQKSRIHQAETGRSFSRIPKKRRF